MAGFKGFGTLVAKNGKNRSSKNEVAGGNMRRTRSSSSGQALHTQDYQEGWDADDRPVRKGRKSDRERASSPSRLSSRREATTSRQRTRTPSPTKELSQRKRPKSPVRNRQRGRSQSKKKEDEQNEVSRKPDRRGRSSSTHRRSPSKTKDKKSGRSRSRTSRRSKSPSRRSKSPSKAPSANSRSKSTRKPSKSRPRNKPRCKTPLGRTRSVTPYSRRRSEIPETRNETPLRSETPEERTDASNTCNESSEDRNTTPNGRTSSRISKKERQRIERQYKKTGSPEELKSEQIADSLGDSGPPTVTLSIGHGGKHEPKKKDRYHQPEEDFDIGDDNSLVGDLIAETDGDEAFKDFLAKRNQALRRTMSSETSVDASIFEASRDGWLSTYDSCLGAFCGFGNDRRSFMHPKSLESRTTTMNGHRGFDWNGQSSATRLVNAYDQNPRSHSVRPTLPPRIKRSSPSYDSSKTSDATEDMLRLMRFARRSRGVRSDDRAAV